jgi:redox-sensing transcriptional repressor
MKKISNIPTIRRLPQYLNILKEENSEFVSTSLLINKLKLEPVTVRKDLAILNIDGKPRVGYRRITLISAIEDFLGWNKKDEAFIIGVGALGGALIKYNGFENNGLHILAGFDIDTKKVGKDIAGKQIFHISKFKELVDRMKVSIAILTVPGEHAQTATDIAVDAGIKGIWNFTNEKLNVPNSIIVQNENLSSGWALFSVKLNRAHKDR